jgi:hypothetical protein
VLDDKYEAVPSQLCRALFNDLVRINLAGARLYFLYVERDSSQITPEKPLGFLLLVAIPVVTGAVWVIDLIRGWLKSTMSK